MNKNGKKISLFTFQDKIFELPRLSFFIIKKMFFSLGKKRKNKKYEIILNFSLMLFLENDEFVAQKVPDH